MSGLLFTAAELDVADRSAAEERILVALGRELGWVDPGEPTGRLAFVDGVMAAIGAEPTPRPSSAWLASLRRRRPVRALAALRDSFRVAFGPAARPWRARLAAVPVAVATVMLAGSLGVVGAGAAGVRLPDSSQPPPTAPAVAPTTRPGPSVAPEPTSTPSTPPRTVTPTPERSAEPSETPDGGEAGDGAARTARPSERETPEPSDHESHDTPEPSGHETPEPSDHETPGPNETPEAGDA